MTMDEITMTFEHAVSEYMKTAQECDWTEYRPDQDASETMRSGGWLLRDAEHRFLTIVEPDESVLVTLSGWLDLDGSVRENFAGLLKADERQVSGQTLVALVSNGETFNYKFNDELLRIFPQKEVSRLLNLLQRYSKRYIKMDAARRKHELALDRWQSISLNDDDD